MPRFGVLGSPTIFFTLKKNLRNFPQTTPNVVPKDYRKVSGRCILDIKGLRYSKCLEYSLSLKIPSVSLVPFLEPLTEPLLYGGLQPPVRVRARFARPNQFYISSRPFSFRAVLATAVSDFLFLLIQSTSMADAGHKNPPTVDGNSLVAMCLARAGVDKMFGVVGIPVTSLANRAVALGVRFIAFHNEQSAGYAASAYGYLTRRPGVLLTVSGPGCVHGLAGLSNATANAWPMVMISGSSEQSFTGRGDFQELDQLAAVKPFSKFSAKATDITKIPASVFSVIDWAVAGRPGGTYLDVPSDVLHQTVDKSEAERLITEALNSRNKDLIEKPRINYSEIQKAVELLRTAQRPLIVFGKGAAYARAENELTKLVESTGMPFLPTPMGKGLLPDTHELAATAARLNWLLHFGEPPKWSKDVKFILVDICKEEIELRKPCLGIVGDAKDVVGMIHKEIKDDPFCLGRTHPWVEAIKNKTKENVAKMEVQLVKDVVPFNFMTPMRIIRDAILAVGSPAPIVVSEGANTMDIGRAVLVQTEPRTRLDAGTWGTMGVGLGYCIAAAVASPDRLVVAVEGTLDLDSAPWKLRFIYVLLGQVSAVLSNLSVSCNSSMNDLNETLVRYQLPVVVIVFNNGGVYAYHLLLEAFGGKGYLAGNPDELKSALAQAFTARKPTVINVRIDPYAGAESGRLQHKN
ncbi:UNVERIFIED_CONTAM: 2-hydroxyacyl-CoA lyase [Sesamum latifolium]|uniref:2-hydroxyacyl-CoA lyase n=1 Tax=Sesamum latifolium TaxID=2727402 RepID=A0AAW2Y8A5_9LAMI